MDKQPKFDYSDIKFKDNGKLKLIIVVGTRPEIIRLAAVINKACGKSALQIIIEHVLMEARFHLKYTDLPVKEIAYRLNFKNQMDFYSFFKRHYGCSPAEFRAKSMTSA